MVWSWKGAIQLGTPHMNKKREKPLMQYVILKSIVDYKQLVYIEMSYLSKGYVNNKVQPGGMWVVVLPFWCVMAPLCFHIRRLFQRFSSQQGIWKNRRHKTAQ
ncbi:hypothetical protein FKM82_023489 [Ascaphus truei]